MRMVLFANITMYAAMFCHYYFVVLATSHLCEFECNKLFFTVQRILVLPLAFTHPSNESQA